MPYSPGINGIFIEIITGNCIIPFFELKPTGCNDVENVLEN